MPKYFPRTYCIVCETRFHWSESCRPSELVCKRREGRFCFVCPRCGESQTAVNARTNLGRCFRCEENFNAIDFVMLATGRDFVAAVVPHRLPAGSALHIPTSSAG